MTSQKIQKIKMKTTKLKLITKNKEFKFTEDEDESDDQENTDTENEEYDVLIHYEEKLINIEKMRKKMIVSTATSNQLKARSTKVQKVRSAYHHMIDL